MHADRRTRPSGLYELILARSNTGAAQLAAVAPGASDPVLTALVPRDSRLKTSAARSRPPKPAWRCARAQPPIPEQHKRDLIEAGGRREVLMLVPSSIGLRTIRDLRKR
jgi:hypothetical protein